MNETYTCPCEICQQGPQALSTLSHWQLCVELVRLGWDVRETVSSLGTSQPSYTVQVSRWDWHGERTEKISFWGDTSTLTDEERDKVFSTVAHRATRTWNEFPHCVPAQDETGQVAPRPIQHPPWPKAPLSVEYWNGERMVAPDREGGAYHV